MRGINNVYILGRLGQDVTPKTTNNDQQYVDLSIATTRSHQQDGTWIDTTDWHTVRFWKQQAETCVKYLGKGSIIAIEGSLKTDSWTNDAGEKKQRVYIDGRHLHIIPSPFNKSNNDSTVSRQMEITPIKTLAPLKPLSKNVKSKPQLL